MGAAEQVDAAFCDIPADGLVAKAAEDVPEGGAAGWQAA